jgi:ribA/ribD-fused uncharacterized protein
MRWLTESNALFEECVVFFKVHEPFGGLSNMSGGYPLVVNGVNVPSAEALYQACRFPHRPDWQREILAQRSPMAAKMMAKKEQRRAKHTRSDWSAVAVPVMRWVLEVKLAQHPGFRSLLQQTAPRPIVERSRKDRVWGAVDDGSGTLEGRNELGRLLMALRDELPSRGIVQVEPPDVSDFLLLGHPIDPVAWR